MQASKAGGKQLAISWQPVSVTRTWNTQSSVSGHSTSLTNEALSAAVED